MKLISHWRQVNVFYAMSIPSYPRIAIDNATHAQILSVLNAAADAAAETTLAHFRQSVQIENKLGDSGFDPVTIADKQAEQVIRSVVLQAFPQHGFFGEESKQHLVSDQLMWIVDPIDGTRAYISGMPLWGTLIGVYDGQEMVAGILDQPYMKERFIATGFSTNSTQSNCELITPTSTRKLACRRDRTLAEAVFQTTSPDLFTGDLQRSVLQAVQNNVSLVRYGGDCYCYALLAMGFVDVVIETGLQPYDIAPLIPIIKGAGGVITDWQGNSAVGGGSIVACGSQSLHDEVLELVARCISAAK